ncbi:hypothetical protein EYF80_005465 [Liparis tanakae]|uniref:Uncharacterized protein n=1 Tax=Liparis tanakae TaxID=230148 RepID=A0A4Z2J359_9TELE|nr:hypothetical protein EYF80_005465 [Liparis tanakae]
MSSFPAVDAAGDSAPLARSRTSPLTDVQTAGNSSRWPTRRSFPSKICGVTHCDVIRNRRRAHTHTHTCDVAQNLKKQPEESGIGRGSEI